MSETQNQMVITQTCVDLQFTGQKPPVLQCMQYDTNLRLLEIRLQKDGADWPVPEGWAVNLRMKKSDGTSIYQAATYEGCLVYLILTGQMCCVAGEHSFVLEIAGEDQVIQTPVLLLKVWKNPISSRNLPASLTTRFSGIWWRKPSSPWKPPKAPLNRRRKVRPPFPKAQRLPPTMPPLRQPAPPLPRKTPANLKPTQTRPTTGIKTALPSIMLWKNSTPRSPSSFSRSNRWTSIKICRCFPKPSTTP